MSQNLLQEQLKKQEKQGNRSNEQFLEKDILDRSFKAQDQENKVRALIKKQRREEYQELVKQVEQDKLRKDFEL